MPRRMSLTPGMSMTPSASESSPLMNVLSAFTRSLESELAESDFEAFGKQCGKFTKTICGICHDRFIIVDQKEIFWTGASLKDAGRLTFAAAKMGAEIIPGLLASIRKATTSSREYGKSKQKLRKSGKRG